MSKSLSLNLEDELLREVDDAAKELQVPREALLRRAIENYIHQIARRKLRVKLRKESSMTADESMRVLKEFEAIS